ncbi:MAG: hypothetical protein KDD61_18105, partial [Bdellovibrionales bacterium]|nr:hypothetical protein [Bdellovibrionales bacterium]
MVRFNFKVTHILVKAGLLFALSFFVMFSPLNGSAQLKKQELFPNWMMRIIPSLNRPGSKLIVEINRSCAPTIISNLLIQLSEMANENLNVAFILIANRFHEKDEIEKLVKKHNLNHSEIVLDPMGYISHNLKSKKILNKFIRVNEGGASIDSAMARNLVQCEGVQASNFKYDLKPAIEFFKNNCMQCHLGFERRKSNPDQFHYQNDRIIELLVTHKMPPWGIEFNSVKVSKVESLEQMQSFIATFESNPELFFHSFGEAVVRKNNTNKKAPQKISTDSYETTVTLSRLENEHFVLPLFEIDRDIKVNSFHLSQDVSIPFQFIFLRIVPSDYKWSVDSAQFVNGIMADPPKKYGVLTAWHGGVVGKSKYADDQYIELKKGMRVVAEVMVDPSLLSNSREGRITVKMGKTDGSLKHSLQFDRIEGLYLRPESFDNELSIQISKRLSRNIRLITLKPNTFRDAKKIEIGLWTNGGGSRKIFTIHNYETRYHRGYTLESPLSIQKGDTLW